MNVTQSITIDLTVPVRQVIYSKTGDTNRYVEATILNDGVAWDVPSDAVCNVYATDDLGHYYSNSNVTFTDNVITAQLPAISNRGTASTEIEIVSGGQQVATFDFYTEIFQSAVAPSA